MYYMHIAIFFFIQERAVVVALHVNVFCYEQLKICLCKSLLCYYSLEHNL